jgi:phage gp29-like protein
MLIEFTELKNSGAGNDIYERFLLYLNDQITLATLGQTLTTQMPREGGSRAAAQVHQAVRRDILASDAQRLSSTINRDLVRPLVDFKFGPQKVYPQLSIGLPDDQDIKTFADAISELADRGLEVDQRTILDKLGLPEPEEGAKLLQPNTQLTGDDPDAPPEDDSDDSNKDAQRKNASTGKTSKQAAQKKTSVPRRRNWQQY